MNATVETKNRTEITTKNNLRAQILNGLPVSDRRVGLAGISTAVLEGGGGPPIILLHGAGEMAVAWMRTFPELVQTNRIIVPDLPGHGESGTGNGPLDFDRIIAWFDELIEHTCPSPPVVVGHLLGGSIAIHYTLKHRDRIARLVLVDTLGLGHYRPSLKFGLAMAGFIARPKKRTQERLFRQCMLNLDGIRREMDGKFELIESYALERAKTPELQSALRSLMPKFALKKIPPEELSGISIPVSLIWGRHDRQVRLRLAQKAKERFGWPLHIIENAADDPAVEQPDIFLHALRSVVQD